MPICNRGDLIYFAHDVIGVGLGWGRVKSVTMDGSGNISRITVDEPQTVTNGSGTYAMRFRANDGTVKVSQVTFQPDNLVREFALATPTPGINPGDLFLFGLQDQDSIPMLVNRIEPTTDLAAKITAVDASPEVLAADAGYIDSTGTYHEGVPDLVSSITGQNWIEGPPAPLAVMCASSQNLSTINDQGGTTPVLLITVNQGSHIAIDHVEIRWRPVDSLGAWSTAIMAAGQSSISVTGIVRGIEYDVAARNIGVGPRFLASAWTQSTHETESITRIPSGAITLNAYAESNGISLWWTGAQSLDAQYSLEKTSGTALAPGPGWAVIAVMQGSSFLDSDVVPGNTYWYRVRAVNFGGLYGSYSNQAHTTMITG